MHLFARCDCPDWLLEWKETVSESGVGTVSRKSCTELHQCKDTFEDIPLMHTEVQKQSGVRTEVCNSKS